MNKAWMITLGCLLWAASALPALAALNGSAKPASNSLTTSGSTSSATSWSSTSTGTSGADLTSVFGAKEGASVKSGFLFIDGAYVDAPYMISRRGGAILVNDMQVKVLAKEWPSPMVMDKDPGMPPGLTMNNSLKDLDFPDRPGDSWDRQKMRWICTHFPPEEAKQRVIEYYRSLPFVKSAEKTTWGSLRVETYKGEEEFIALRGTLTLPTKDDVTRQLEQDRLKLEDELKSGACVFLFSNGGEVVLAKQRAAEDLGLIAEIIGSDRKADEKILLLQRMDVPIPPSVNTPKWLNMMVSRFKKSDDLTKRIKDLVAETGVTPRELKDIPEEGRIQKERRRIEALEKKAKEAAKANATGSGGATGI